MRPAPYSARHTPQSHLRGYVRTQLEHPQARKLHVPRLLSSASTCWGASAAPQFSCMPGPRPRRKRICHNTQEPPVMLQFFSSTKLARLHRCFACCSHRRIAFLPRIGWAQQVVNRIRRQKRAKHPFAPWADEDRALLPTPRCLVMGWPVDPDVGGRVDVASPHDRHFPWPHARQSLDLNHGPYWCRQVRQHGFHMLIRHWGNPFGFPRLRTIGLEPLHRQQSTVDRLRYQLLGDSPFEQPLDPPDTLIDHSSTDRSIRK